MTFSFTPPYQALRGKLHWFPSHSCHCADDETSSATGQDSGGHRHGRVQPHPARMTPSPVSLAPPSPGRVRCPQNAPPPVSPIVFSPRGPRRGGGDCRWGVQVLWTATELVAGPRVLRAAVWPLGSAVGHLLCWIQDGTVVLLFPLPLGTFTSGRAVPGRKSRGLTASRVPSGHPTS